DETCVERGDSVREVLCQLKGTPLRDSHSQPVKRRSEIKKSLVCAVVLCSAPGVLPERGTGSSSSSLTFVTGGQSGQSGRRKALPSALGRDLIHTIDLAEFLQKLWIAIIEAHDSGKLRAVSQLVLYNFTPDFDLAE